jgi:hypothetical protein
MRVKAVKQSGGPFDSLGFKAITEVAFNRITDGARSNIRDAKPDSSPYYSPFTIHHHKPLHNLYFCFLTPIT